MYRFADHTGEVELELDAPAEAGIFAAAVEAFSDLAAVHAGGEPARRELEVLGRDRALLLVDLLNELIYLGETEGFLPERLLTIDLEEDRLRTTVVGRVGEPRHLVKAVTLNKLELGHEGGAWHGHVVLDV